MVSGPQHREETAGHRAALLLSPAAVYLMAVVGGALLLAVYLSSTDAAAGSLSGHFVGLGNFRRALRDPMVLRALRNTVVIALTSQFMATMLGLVLANFLTIRFRGRHLLLFFILLPWAAPVALGTLGWKWILDSLFSVVNWSLRAAHLVGVQGSPQWLGDPALAMISIIAVETWRSLPFDTVILLAGLACLPTELDDAAGSTARPGGGRWSTSRSPS